MEKDQIKWLQINGIKRRLDTADKTIIKKIEEIIKNESLERKKKKQRENLKHSQRKNTDGLQVRLSDDSTVKGPKSHS